VASYDEITEYVNRISADLIAGVHHITWTDWQSNDGGSGIDLQAVLGSLPVCITLSHDEVTNLIPQVTELLRQLNDYVATTAVPTATTTR
jgi:hypothetical protein